MVSHSPCLIIPKRSVDVEQCPTQTQISPSIICIFGVMIFVLSIEILTAKPGIGYVVKVGGCWIGAGSCIGVLLGPVDTGFAAVGRPTEPTGFIH